MPVNALIPFNTFSTIVVTPLWMPMKELIFAAFQMKLDYTVLEILLGIPCKKNTVMCVINFVILYAKRYIYNCKIHQKNYQITSFLKV